MDEFDFLCFAALFREAYQKCFGHAIKNPMTETESKIFCNKILDLTGLSIGWKSVKNYSFFVMDATAVKKENPSVATLDTIARYVLGAPYTTEIQRKDHEGHYPYWFLYREKFQIPVVITQAPRKRSAGLLVILTGIAMIILLAVYFKFKVSSAPTQFSDDFHNLSEQFMLDNGWTVKSKDNSYWNKRGEVPGVLSLYTLNGDNWPDPHSKPDIKNLLLRPINSDCFTAEVHMRDFVPMQEWQQAGILLLEDTTFTGKSIRLSLAFNDNFGGMKMSREILVQAITSLGNGFGKPEEIAHKPVFNLDSTKNSSLLTQNLKNTALRIEKHGNKYRFLYAGGNIENGAFKEVASQEFEMKPKYIGIFAIKGFTKSTNVPVKFTFFKITGEPCE